MEQEKYDRAILDSSWLCPNYRFTDPPSRNFGALDSWSTRPSSENCIAPFGLLIITIRINVIHTAATIAFALTSVDFLLVNILDKSLILN